jgi:5-hydroxyisourate hydrolase-like protein (transthyretin family)
VKFRVLFKGKPLVNLLVKTWHREKNGTTQMQEYRTNNRGIVTVKRYSGPFMVSAVYMERLNGDEKADWQSYWASLNFEYSSFFSIGR